SARCGTLRRGSVFSWLCKLWKFRTERQFWCEPDRYRTGIVGPDAEKPFSSARLPLWVIHDRSRLSPFEVRLAPKSAAACTITADDFLASGVRRKLAELQTLDARLAQCAGCFRGKADIRCWRSLRTRSEMIVQRG